MISAGSLCICGFRTKQLQEEGRAPCGRVSARTRLHQTQRDDVTVRILPQQPAVRTGRGSTKGSQGGHPTGVRGHADVMVLRC